MEKDIPMSAQFEAARKRMVEEQLVRRGIKDKKVLEAMRKIPRHRFVQKDMEYKAYADYPLPIGNYQTISQPYIVALMTEALGLSGKEKTLEIGTGSGYQAAILAELSSWLYTVEKYPELLEKAVSILKELGYDNFSAGVSDGTLGWKEHAPFDAIMVTAGAPGIPQSLQDQLAEGGRLLIPVGNHYLQELILLTKKQGRLDRKNLGGCRFVPLQGEQGWK
ncbi:MAG: protein-L-isoaspartate(D-aspartate) O-methyltransferase [Thermodesulfobacteriota bacterium]